MDTRLCDTKLQGLGAKKMTLTRATLFKVGILAFFALFLGGCSGPSGTVAVDVGEVPLARAYRVDLYATDVSQGMVDGVSVTEGRQVTIEDVPEGRWAVFVQAQNGDLTTIAHAISEVEVSADQVAEVSIGRYRPGLPGDTGGESESRVEVFGPGQTALLSAVYGASFERGEAAAVDLLVENGPGVAVLDPQDRSTPLIARSEMEDSVPICGTVGLEEREAQYLAERSKIMLPSMAIQPRFGEIEPGETIRFFIATTFREAECVRLLDDNQTTHCLIFAESVDGTPVLSSERALEVAEAFDNLNPFSTSGQGIYQETRVRFGSEWKTNPPGGRDGDERVVLVFLSSTTIGGRGLFGFFRPADQLSKEEASTSNEGEILYINAERSMADAYDALVTIAHEFSHLILYNQKVVQNGTFPEGARQESTVLDEGLAVLNEELCGFGLTGEEGGNFFLIRSLEAALVNGLGSGFFEFSGRLSDYGSGYLFWRYLHDRFGMVEVSRMVENPNTGKENIQDVLDIPFTSVFLDFAQATALQPGDPRPQDLTYQDLDLFGTYPIRGGETVTLNGLQGVRDLTLPGTLSTQEDLPPWGVVLYRVTGGDGSPLIWQATGADGLATDSLLLEQQ